MVGLVAERVEKTQGRISAKQLLSAGRAAGFGGSDRNLRGLAAEQVRVCRREHLKLGADAEPRACSHGHHDHLPFDRRSLGRVHSGPALFLGQAGREVGL